MKKHLLFFIFALTITSMRAQNGELYSYMTHDMGDYHINIENFIRQKDGEFVINTFIGTDSGSPFEPPINIGNIFYKMSPISLTITDSLFVENPDAPYYLFAPNPTGDGNIRANFEYHEDCDSTFLCICHFPDNDLNISHDEDIVVPLCEGYAFGNFDSHMVDCRGNLIMKYCTIRPNGGYDEHIARFSPDGTLLHQALLFENQNIVSKLRVLKETPLQYYQWDYYDNNNLVVYVIDSLFNKNTVIFNKILNEVSLSDTIYFVEYEYLNFNNDTEVIPIDGDDVLVAASYTNDTNFNPLHGEYGMAVVKYDMRTQQRKGMVVFNDFPQETGAQCLGLKRLQDGTVYFLYKEVGYPNGTIVVVKMDADLNVEWKRTYKTDDIVISAPLYFPILFEDGQEEEKGIAWIGYGRKPGNDKADLFYFFLNHDGTVGMNEKGIEVRPYCFYPNPVKEQLLMQFSPDVQPVQIELYDLQGRLVRTQSKAFESIDMSQLPAGTYTLRVTLEDGKTYSDKVVKE